MATQKTIEIVKSTAPILKEHGEEITTVFYKMMLEDHPELKDVFNMTHQKKGSQARVLANAVFQYATHIEELDKLDKTVKSIVQKHVSLSITPEMYPIVGKYLLMGIKKVLGESATDEIINAWAEAYGDLASIFIGLEEEVYKKVASEEGGFRGQQDFVVIKKEKESSLITSFYLKNPTQEKLPSFLPGQYIAVSVNIEGEEHLHTRNYSLSDVTNKEYLRISVKKEESSPKGIVSNYLHGNIEVGNILKLGIPGGDFVLKDSNNPVLLIGAGVGVTPLISMYKTLVNNTKREVTFVQGAINSKHQAFKEELTKDLKTNVNYISVYSDPLEKDVLQRDYDFKGFINETILQPYLTEETEVYFCGPTPFMANVIQALKKLKVKEANINYEFFGPPEELVVEESLVV